MSPESQSFLEIQRFGVGQILFEAGCVDINFDRSHTFSSGIQSPIKVDCEKLKDSPENFGKIVSKLEEVIGSTFGDYRFFCGVIKGGVPLAEELAKRFAVRAIFRLGIKPDEVRQSMVSGTIERNHKGIIIEDVSTTGKNIELCAQQIEDEGGFHLGAVVIFDYGFKIAQDNLYTHGLRLWRLTTFDQLIEVGQQLGKFTLEEATMLGDWWKETCKNLLNTAQVVKI